MHPGGRWELFRCNGSTNPLLRNKKSASIPKDGNQVLRGGEHSRHLFPSSMKHFNFPRNYSGDAELEGQAKQVLAMVPWTSGPAFPASKTAGNTQAEGKSQEVLPVHDLLPFAQETDLPELCLNQPATWKGRNLRWKMRAPSIEATGG